MNPFKVGDIVIAVGDITNIIYGGSPLKITCIDGAHLFFAETRLFGKFNHYCYFKLSPKHNTPLGKILYK